MSTSVFTAFLCLMHLCTSSGAVNNTAEAIESLHGRSTVLGKEMLMATSYGWRWLIAHPWYTGEIPVSDLPNYPKNAGDKWVPPAGMRMAIGSAKYSSPFYVWMEPSTNYTQLGASKDSLYVALDKLYGHGLANQTFRIGLARGGVLQEPARGANDPLPDALTTPVGSESVMLGGRDTTCGTEPSAGDPALALPGTDAPATRCHRDAWKETEACTADHFDYVPNGSGGWTPIQIYKKTELVEGWNINQPFTPTYAQLVDTVAYPAGTTAPPVPPTWAPQTNPSTFFTPNCLTNASAPDDAVGIPPATITSELSYGSCPSGYTGQITYQRVHTHFWAVNANPADVYTPWDQLSDTCVLAPGQAVDTNTGQVCTASGQWIRIWAYEDTGGSQPQQVTLGYWWTGNYTDWLTYHNGTNIPWVPNICNPTSPPPPAPGCDMYGACRNYTGAYGNLVFGASLDSRGGGGDGGLAYGTYKDAITGEWGVQVNRNAGMSYGDAKSTADTNNADEGGLSDRDSGGGGWGG